MSRVTRSARRMRARRIRWSCCVLLFSGIWFGWNSLPRPTLLLMAFAAGACVVSHRRADAVANVIRIPGHGDKPRTAAMPRAAAKVWQEVDTHRDILDLLRQRTRSTHRGMGHDGYDR